MRIKVFLFHFLLCFIAKSQDVIVTQAGDSIKCKIDEETPVLFLFSQQKQSGAIVRSQIFKTMVKNFKYDYKSKSQTGSGNNVVRHSSVDAESIDRRAYRNYMRYQLGFQFGSFYGNEPIPNTTLPNDYVEKLKNGNIISIEADYFLNDNIGFGIQYLNYKSLNQLSDAVFIGFDGKAVQGKLSDKQALNLLALQGHFRYYLNYKMLLTGSISTGYGFYNNELRRATEKGKLKANGFFTRPCVSFDYLVGNDVIGRDLSMGLEFGYLFGGLNEQKYQSNVSNLTSTLPKQNLRRFDINLTLKFYKFPKYLRLTSR